jgi:alkylhydroperoxidase family enzyme
VRLGATDEQLEKLVEYRTGPFTDAEKAALEYAERMTTNPRSIDDALMAHMRRFYTDAEIVEIVAMAGIFNYLNRVAESLDIAPTKPGEGIETAK